MPKLIVKSGEAQGESIELRPGVNRLGRGRHNDFPIEHPTVSTVHCEITCDERAVLVRDCGSTNGTFINGNLITESRLNPGETLHLGVVEMVLETEPMTIAIPRVDFAEAPAPGLLPDGSEPCFKHPEVRARRQCTQCQKCFCEPCIHTLRRVGGKVLKLCPLCSGPCAIIPGREEGPRKKKSILGSIWPFKKTLKIVRKKGGRR